MEGSCSTGQSPQRAVVPVGEEEEVLPDDEKLVRIFSFNTAVPSSAFSCLCGYKFNATVFIALLLSAVLYHFSIFAFSKSSY
jgi:hypothetical protein